MNFKLLWSTFLCAACLGCSSGPTGPAQIHVLDFGLNSTAQFSWDFVQTDSSGQRTVVATDTFVTNVASTNDVVGNDSQLIRMVAYSIPHFMGWTQVWYKPYPDSLVEVGYSSAGAAGMILPKVSGSSSVRYLAARSTADYVRMPLIVQDLLRSHALQDSVIERVDRRIVYAYPLAEGKSWTSFRYPFLENRQVDGYEMVYTGRNAYWCAKIRTTLPGLDPDTEWFDYVTWQGLIKRTIRRQAWVTTQENPDGPGVLMEFDETLTLMD